MTMDNAHSVVAGLFIDGSILEIVRDETPSGDPRPPLSSFIECAKRTARDCMRLPAESKLALTIQWFRGEFSESENRKRARGNERELEKLIQRENQLLKELDEVGITEEFRHRRLMYARRNSFGGDEAGTDRFEEKGIDTKLLVEAIDFVSAYKPKLLILAGADGDHISLIEWLKPRGCKSLLLYYENSRRSRHNRQIRTHHWLLKEADYRYELRIDKSTGFVAKTRESWQQQEAEAERFYEAYFGAQPVPRPGQPARESINRR